MRTIAMAALAVLVPGWAAAGFSVLGEPCKVVLDAPAGVERFPDLLAAQRAIAGPEDHAADVAAAAKALCGESGCTAWTPVDDRNGESIHVIIPDDKGGAYVLRDMGWLGGATACNKGEPHVRKVADGLFLVRVDEHTGAVLNEEDRYCSDDQVAASALLLDVARSRWLIRATAIGANDGIKVEGDAVTAKACGQMLDTSLAALKTGQAALMEGGAPPAADHRKLCEVEWPKAEKGERQQAWTCMTHFLTLAYGGKPDAEALSLDPGYGHPVEVKLGTADLERMIRHVAGACDLSAAPVESECNRANELFVGMHRRRLGVFDDTIMASIEPALGKALRGEALTVAELKPPDGPRLSALSLWKLRNAAYARHGYRFKTPDLNAFFYDSRSANTAEKSALLPLKVKAKGEVKLTAQDGANVKLIKGLEAEARAAAGR